MLYQVLQLSPEQINALPPAERDAIQQLVGRDSSVALFGRLTLGFFLCFVTFSLPRFEEESIHGRRYPGLRLESRRRGSRLPSLTSVAGFWVRMSHY